MRRILVLTSIERAFYSSTVEYQLFDPIAEVSKISKNKFMYIGFVPITFWMSSQEPFKSFVLYRRYRQRIRQFLHTCGIRCRFIPIFFPVRHKDFYLRIPWLILYVLNTLPLLIYFILFYRINLIHARNYPAGLLCFLVRCVLGTPYIFDMRDLYPEKGVEAGVFGKLEYQISTPKYRSGWSYRVWKFIEINLLRGSNFVIVTSTPFYEYIEAKMHNLLHLVDHSYYPKIQIIPNCVNTERFKPNPTKRKSVRTHYEIDNKFVLIHSGAFGTSQDIHIVGKYFLKWKSLMRDIGREAHLVILYGMKKMVPYLHMVLESVGIYREDYTIISAQPVEVPYLLLLGDVGLHLETMAIATPYCIAVKDGEYLAAGLPVIVTSWLKGIAHLVEKYEAGIVVNPLDDDFTKERMLLNAYKDMREGGIRLVKEYLSLGNSVKQFVELYQ